MEEPSGVEELVVVSATIVIRHLSEMQEKPMRGNKIVAAVTVEFLTAIAMTRLPAFSDVVDAWHL